MMYSQGDGWRGLLEVLLGARPFLGIKGDTLGGSEELLKVLPGYVLLMK